MRCIKCENYTNCVEYGFIDEVSECANFSQVKPKTNFDRIKAMSVEEMAELFNDWLYEGACNHGLDIERECDHNCIECIKQYLKSEVQEDEI